MTKRLCFFLWKEYLKYVLTDLIVNKFNTTFPPMLGIKERKVTSGSFEIDIAPTK